MAVMSPLRAWIRMAASGRTALSPVQKIIRAALMLPAFGVIFILLRIRLMIRNPIQVDVFDARGSRFRCHPPDLIQLYLWIFGEWEPDLTAFISSRLSKGDVFVDVGANIGYYSILASRAVGDSGRVVAVEASPAVFEALRETIAMNDVCDRVRAINCAAAAQPGFIDVYSGPRHNTGLTSTIQRRGMHAQAQVPSQPIDDLLQSDEFSRARLIKIDVEGAEDQVLAGMCSIIRHGRRDLEILVELSPQWWADPSRRPIDVLQPLIDAGFHAYTIDNNYWMWRYLWPRCVKRPQRLRSDFTHRVHRLDLVLSRLDAEEL